MRTGLTSITERLVLIYVLISLFAVVLVGFLSYRMAKNALVSRTFEQLISVREFKRKQVENFFNDRSSDAEYLARLIASSGMGSESRPDSLIKIFVRESAYYDFAAFVPAAGTGKSPAAINYDKIPLAGQRPLPAILMNSLSVAYKSNSTTKKEYYNGTTPGTPSIFIITPAIERGVFLGAVVLSVRHQSVNSIMYESSPGKGLGKTGETYLVGSDMLMRSSSRFVENTVYNMKVATRGASAALSGRHGTAVYGDYRGQKVLGAFRKLDLPGLDWVILAEIDYDEANVPIIEIRNSIIFLSVMISVIVFIFTYIISKKISNPLIRLTNAAKNIEKGMYIEKLEIESNDEIGTLADSFNKMADELKKHEEALALEKMKRARSSIDAQEHERERLARELHDGLGQSLIALKLRLENIELSAETPMAQKMLDGLKAAFDSLIDETRRISNGLQPAVLKELGLAAALRNICREISGLLGIEVSMAIDPRVDELNKSTKVYIFRIVQEALNNSVKHSSATEISVSCSLQEEFVHLSLSDNGKGFNFEESKFGNGIFNIMDRAKLIGGEAVFSTFPGNGTKIIINFPAKL